MLYIFWIFSDPPHCLPFFTFYPWLIMSHDPRVTFWICYGICGEIHQYFSWHLPLKTEKNCWKQNILCPQLVMCSSCLSYLSLLDDRSLLQNVSQGAKLRPDSLSPDPRTAQSVIWLISLKSRETEKYFTKYSKVFNICLPGCQPSCQYSWKNIYKHLTRQNWLTNVDEQWRRK